MAIMHARLKELRNRKGMTLAQVADALGTTEATAQRYESGKGIKSIPYEVIEKYANLFGCKPQYIVGWEDEIENDPVGTANRMVDSLLRLGIELKEEESDLSDQGFVKMIDEYKQLDENKQEQVREYVHFLLERS